MTEASVATIAKKSTGWAVVLSLLMVLAGILAIVHPGAAGLALTLLITWLLIINGVFHIVFAWQTPTKAGFIWELLLGIVYGAAGIYLLARPLVALAALTLVLALYLFAEGILELILWFRSRALPHSSWMLLLKLLGFSRWISSNGTGFCRWPFTTVPST